MIAIGTICAEHISPKQAALVLIFLIIKQEFWITYGKAVSI